MPMMMIMIKDDQCFCSNDNDDNDNDDDDDSYSDVADSDDWLSHCMSSYYNQYMFVFDYLCELSYV